MDNKNTFQKFQKVKNNKNFEHAKNPREFKKSHFVGYKNQNLNFHSKTNQIDQNSQNFQKNEDTLDTISMTAPDHIFGRKVVLDAINNNLSINKICFSKGIKGEIINTIFRKARDKKIVFSFIEKRDMDKKFGPNTQGVLAFTTSKEYLELDELFKKIEQNKSKNFKICILDSITDPHNTGAIIRSAYAFEFDAILIPQRNSCLVNATVIKASAGAANLMPIVRIGNITDIVKQLKEKNFSILGADMAGQNITDILNKNLTNKNICLILGSEGEGIKRLVKENCDFLVKIPMSENFDSLNVSCAGAILFYELMKK